MKVSLVRKRITFTITFNCWYINSVFPMIDHVLRVKQFPRPSSKKFLNVLGQNVKRETTLLPRWPDTISFAGSCLKLYENLNRVLFCHLFQASGILILCIGIWMKIQLEDYVGMGMEDNGAALSALACLGVFITLASTFACYCTTRGHPALLYLVSTCRVVLLFTLYRTTKYWLSNKPPFH